MSKKHHKSKKADSMYTKIFRLYDEDNDGYVDLSFLGEMMRSAGAIFLDSELEKPMEKLRNANGADVFNQKDYQDLCVEYTKNEDTPEDLMEAFKFWDSDGSGKVTTEEIRQALTTLGDVLSEDEINALIKERDEKQNLVKKQKKLIEKIEEDNKKLEKEIKKIIKLNKK